jgi:hypothetical protein
LALLGGTQDALEHTIDRYQVGRLTLYRCQHVDSKAAIVDQSENGCHPAEPWLAAVPEKSVQMRVRLEPESGRFDHAALLLMPEEPYGIAASLQLNRDANGWVHSRRHPRSRTRCWP